MDGPQFGYPFIHQQTLGCFCLLTTVNNAAMNKGVYQNLFEIWLPTLLSIYSEVGILDLTVILCFII